VFKVPIDYQCAILVFHAASHPQCEQLPRNAQGVARRGPGCEERRADAWLPIGNRITKGSREILPFDAMPAPEISQTRITNSAWSFYLVTEYLPPLFAGWPSSCRLMESMIL